MKRECEMSVRPSDGRRRLLALIALLSLISVASASCDRPSQASTPRSTLRAPNAPVRNPMLDSDEDGIPDGAELRTANDRENFRRWFTAIAEAQFYQVSNAWTVEQQDCAGLVRFAWREALRPHDRMWMKSTGGFSEPVAPDPKLARPGDSPLGDKLFRTDFGVFKETNLTDGTFSEFADARTLKNYNVNFVGRDRREALPGDLLFFHQPWVQSFPFHVMIFLGTAREAGEGASDWVVYHTGSGASHASSPAHNEGAARSAPESGTIKKVRLSVLDHHPSARWRPLIDNPNFLGFYRLKILD